MLFGRHSLVITDHAGRRLARLTVSRSLQLAILALLGLTAAGGTFGLMRWRKVAQRAPHAHALERQTAELAALLAGLQRDVAEARRTLTDGRFTLAHLHRRIGLYESPLDATEDPEPPLSSADPADTVARAATLLAEAQRLEISGAELLEGWRDAERRLRHTPSIRPARTAWMTSSFGVRSDPMLGHWVMHKGLDMGGPLGMLILAPADGVVVWTGLRGGYGQLVVLDHGWGLQTHFAHLSRALVERGQSVTRGEPIAEMGSSGRSTGPHLHYEVRQDGVPLDPRRFILD